ncbi:hypothetical protein [Geodermatophilus normandii]|uniref:Uncharacterized protein n=1 Tax=Geodermatophilus normandii TaxID=1137989 RepID=A0A6P0GLL7_9ACTN|nr:hypothetical protein [Geodermatophilus normandii]NEM07912.1 hypothetical protein [Geodermatophilus normandii]
MKQLRHDATLASPVATGKASTINRSRKRLGAAAAATAVALLVMAPTAAHADHTTDLPSCGEATGWFTGNAVAYVTGAGLMIVGGPVGWAGLGLFAYETVKLPLEAQDLEACQR